MNRTTMVLLLFVGPMFAQVAEGAAPQDDATRARRRTPVVEVFESRRDAVVNISSTEIVRVKDPFDRIFGGFFERPFRGRPHTRQIERTSIGSGFVIHPAGYIVTNAHVVTRAADVRVGLSNELEYEARIIASDRDNDLAVIKVDAPGALSILPMGTNDDLMVGETVIAIGNPLGFQHTVTAGVVSAINRDLVFGEGMIMNGLIQTDASINPGNSGGPLLNVLGELIGINTAIRGDAENIGFAIPVARLRRLLPELLDVERSYDFVTGLTLSIDTQPTIIAVEVGSPADRADLRVGDELRAVGNATIREPVDFHIALIGHRPGDRLSLEVSRDGSTRTVNLRLAARPPLDPERLADERLGIAVTELPHDVARDLRLPRGAGLVVIDVRPDGPAAVAGLRPRDVLVSTGRFHPVTRKELGEVLDHVKTGSELIVNYLRVRPPEIIRYRAPITVQ